MISSVSPERQATRLAVEATRLAGIGALFVCVSVVVGLIVACFVPPEWVISAEDAAFLHSNPHGVVDLSEDYGKLLGGYPLTAERHTAITSHRRQLWIAFWLRWGAVSLFYGALLVAVNRIFGLRAMLSLAGASALGLFFFVGIYLWLHPGFDPMY